MIPKPKFKDFLYKVEGKSTETSRVFPASENPVRTGWAQELCQLYTALVRDEQATSLMHAFTWRKVQDALGYPAGLLSEIHGRSFSLNPSDFSVFEDIALAYLSERLVIDEGDDAKKLWAFQAMTRFLTARGINVVTPNDQSVHS